MKSLAVLENELIEIERQRDKFSGLPLPSQRDDAVATLKEMSGHALSMGGLETVLRLVQQARARGEL